MQKYAYDCNRLYVTFTRWTNTPFFRSFRQPRRQHQPQCLICAIGPVHPQNELVLISGHKALQHQAIGIQQHLAIARAAVAQQQVGGGIADGAVTVPAST